MHDYLRWPIRDCVYRNHYQTLALGIGMNIEDAYLDRCSNILCPNKTHEGRMVWISFPGERRDVKLYMCAPCAQEIANSIAKDNGR